MSYSSLFPPVPNVPPQNIHNILFRRQDQSNWPDFPLYVNAITGQTRSYKEFLELARDGATAMSADVNLGGLGIQRQNNELVGILSENSMDYVALIHSLLVMTVPFTMFSSYSTPFEFQQMFKLAGPTRLFVSPSLLPLALGSGLPDDRIYILEGEVEGRISYGQLVARARRDCLPRLPIQPAQKDTLAYLVFSSGTSGLPKAVMVSHGNLIDSTLQYSVSSAEAVKAHGRPAWNGPDGRNVILNVLPINHTYALHVVAFRCFFAPVTIVLLPKWNANAFFDCIPKHRVTSLYIVPSLAHQIVHHPKFQTTDLSTVQVVRCGAAHLPTSLAEQFCSRFPGVDRIGEGYGMSESTSTVIGHPPSGILGGRAKHIPGSLGLLLPGVEARIVREDGRLAAINDPGELYIRAGCVALGYWRNPKATRETFKDGWLRTGDRVRIDADGVLYFEDRAKDTLKISGMQVSPMEIEETLLRHPEQLIIDVCVAGVIGGRTADERVPRAWVVLSPYGEALGASRVIARLDAWTRETLSRYKHLRGGIGVVKQIPKSPTGKMLRRALVEEYEAESRMRMRMARL